MANEADNKLPGTALKTLPDNVHKFVNEKIAKGEVAELSYEVDADYGDAVYSNVVINGNKEDVVFVGYPFVIAIRTVDPHGDKVITPSLPDMGLNLSTLYWDQERHAFACVRNDVYAA